jgi:hypothetical protein
MDALQAGLGMGRVVVVLCEQALSKTTLYGITQPLHVMDSISTQSGADLDLKTSRTEQV